MAGKQVVIYRTNVFETRHDTMAYMAIARCGKGPILSRKHDRHLTHPQTSEKSFMNVCNCSQKEKRANIRSATPKAE